MTYQMLIEADQNNYIIAITQMISIVANTAISALLIMLGFSIHVVKLGSAVVFIIPPIFYLLYARKKYGIDKKVPHKAYSAKVGCFRSSTRQFYK